MYFVANRSTLKSAWHKVKNNLQLSAKNGTYNYCNDHMKTEQHNRAISDRNKQFITQSYYSISTLLQYIQPHLYYLIYFINNHWRFSLFHRAFQFTMCFGPTNALVCNKTLLQMSRIKTLKITPTCFDHQLIIIRELLILVKITG
jgi:hypothetical protein